MLRLDHLATWTRERDALVGRLSDLSGCPVLDGYAPFGTPVARGVRFSNGVFLDIHQLDGEGAAGHCLVGLQGPVDEYAQMAARQGWGFRAARGKRNDGSPWSLLSFRRRQGILSQLFVIEYAAEPEAWASPVFDQPLYRAGAPREGAGLRRIWLHAVDVEDAAQALATLGFIDGGLVESGFSPRQGRLFHGVAGDLVLSPGPDDAVIRFDLDSQGAARLEPFGERLSLVVGEAP